RTAGVSRVNEVRGSFRGDRTRGCVGPVPRAFISGGVGAPRLAGPGRAPRRLAGASGSGLRRGRVMPSGLGLGARFSLVPPALDPSKSQKPGKKRLERAGTPIFPGFFLTRASKTIRRSRGSRPHGGGETGGFATADSVTGQEDDRPMAKK